MRAEKEISEEIIIKRISTPFIINVLLMIFTLISFLIPIIATIFLFTQDIAFNPVILITYVIFWGVGIYLLRLLLWNTYGQERLTLEKKKIKYVADFKFFQDGRQEISTDRIETEIIYEDTMDLSVGRIRIKNQNNIIETVLKSPLTELNKLNTKIKTRYNNTLLPAGLLALLTAFS